MKLVKKPRVHAPFPWVLYGHNSLETHIAAAGERVYELARRGVDVANYGDSKESSLQQFNHSAAQNIGNQEAHQIDQHHKKEEAKSGNPATKSPIPPPAAILRLLCQRAASAPCK